MHITKGLTAVLVNYYIIVCTATNVPPVKVVNSDQDTNAIQAYKHQSMQQQLAYNHPRTKPTKD